MIRSAEAVLVLAALSAGILPAQEPSQQRYVGEIDFRGNRALDDLTLLAGISTSPSGQLFQLFRLGDKKRWDEIEFRRDVVRLQLLYRQHGYYEARVDTAVDRRDALVDVTFRIQEGPPILVDTLTITGVDSIPGSARLAARIPLRLGQAFDRTLFEMSADTISFHARNHGYPYALVFRNYSVDRRTRTARVTFDVLPGPHARIAANVVDGNRQVSERTILRSLVVHPGEEFRVEQLYESQRSLYQTELFRYASVGIDADSAVGGVDSLVRVRVQVAEATPLQIRAGAGYGTIDCLRASGTLTRLNFLGEARRLDVVGRLSKLGVGSPLGFEHSICRELLFDDFSKRVNYLGSVTLTQPTLFLRRSTISLSGFAERRSEFNAYLFESFGGVVGLKFGFGRHVPITLNYRLSRDQTDAQPATYCVYFDTCEPAVISLLSDPLRQATLTLSVVNRNTDSPIEPTIGHVWTFEATTASPLLGSEVVFDRVVAEAVGYTRWRHKFFAARLRVGIIRQGQSHIGDSTLRYVPPASRFYSGGPNTVRGFARNEMGPLVYVADSVDVQPNGAGGADSTYIGVRSSPIGSGAIVLGNVEMRVPTPLWAGKVALAAFVDAGELWDYTAGTLVPGGVKVTPGMGIQISTPLGPMRVDAAYNGYRTEPGPLYLIRRPNLELQPRPYSGAPRGKTVISRLQWHFSVGLAF